ncbi:MAG: ccsA [Cyanobacteria bacterium RYN_339]|nr:ccsA [Cyanobacteria bacterium RYN_339]
MNLLDIETTAATATFIAAGLAMLVFLAQLATNRDGLKPIGMAGMAVAFVGSLVTLIARGLIAQHVPWSNLWESMIFMLFGTLAVYFLVEWWYRPKHFGVVAAPLCLVLIGGASLLPPGLKHATPLVPALQSYWIKIHTSAILVSYGAFTMAFAATVAYLVVEWRSRQQPVAQALPLAAGGSFPPPGFADGPSRSGGSNPPENPNLAFFDELSYRLILLGFPLLMFGIITGGIWANEVWGSYWSWDPKETWALITWFIYAAYLHARISRDVSGRKAAWLSVGGFVSMGVCYLGVNYLSSGLHSYGFLK